MAKKLSCILLVDDNDADNEYHQIVIERMSIAESIRVAENGEEALAFLKKSNEPVPELIFLDINMPRMNGWEFLEEYKKLGIGKHQIIILMLSTSANPADIARAKTIEEVTGFETKPLTPAMLTKILADYF